MQVIFAPLQWNDLRVASRAFLHLASPLAPGVAVTVVAKGLNASWNNASISLHTAFDPAALNTNIRVNQIGFLPTVAKRAWLGQFAGADAAGNNVGVKFFATTTTTTTATSSGGSGKSTGSSSNGRSSGHDSVSRAFDVVDAVTGAVVLDGTAAPAGGAAFNLTGQDLWTLDLSSVQTPGWYRVRVPGVGVSHSFQISPRVFDQVRREGHGPLQHWT
jgi:hypothetical protein